MGFLGKALKHGVSGEWSLVSWLWGWGLGWGSPPGAPESGPIGNLVYTDKTL